jgi:hypothetical protein
MSSLAELPDLVGFFSYSRRDDEHSDGALSRLRARIHSELRLQLGRELRLWQDTAAIPEGTVWGDEIKRAIAESVFFIPIVTPSAVGSKNCRLEFESFVKREASLGRNNLIFPLIYVRVPALEKEELWFQDEVLTTIGTRQYIDWQKFRHRNFSDPDIAEKIEQYCTNIVEALRQPWVSPEARREAEQEQRRAEDERQRRQAEIEARQHAEEQRKRAAEAQQKAEAERRGEEKKRQQEAEADARRRSEQERPAAKAYPQTAEQPKDIQAEQIVQPISQSSAAERRPDGTSGADRDVNPGLLTIRKSGNWPPLRTSIILGIGLLCVAALIALAFSPSVSTDHLSATNAEPNEIAASQQSAAQATIPVPISPPDGATFDIYPRVTTLKWQPVPDVASYEVEVEAYSRFPPTPGWFTHPGQWPTFVSNTQYQFQFVGAQPGRWRVTAILRNGVHSQPSAWQGFTYTN